LRIVQHFGPRHLDSSAGLTALLTEAGELSAIFSQSQLTAKSRAGGHASGRNRGTNPQSPQ
jgi:hypothetical protein